MSLETVSIPEHVRAQLAAQRVFVGHALGSWRDCAATTNELLRENFRRLGETAEAEEKAFLGWEIVCAAVELSEIAATALRHARDPQSSPFHSADNPTLRAIFQSIKENGLPDLEARQFLRLRVPPGFGKAALRVVSVYSKLVARLQYVVRGIAEFWLMHADNARWFRHLPMSLTLAEAATIASDKGVGREEVVALIEATLDPLEVFALLDEKSRAIEYHALRMDDVRAARATAAWACELVINWIANFGFDPAMRQDERRLFPFLTAALTEAEKKVLETDGKYILAERAASAQA